MEKILKNIKVTQKVCRFCTNFIKEGEKQSELWGRPHLFGFGRCGIDNTEIRTCHKRCVNQNFNVNIDFVNVKYINKDGNNEPTHKSIFGNRTLDVVLSFNDVEGYFKNEGDALLAYNDECHNVITRLDGFMVELNNLKEKYGVSLYYFMEGDTYGIYDDGQTITIDNFTFEIEY